MVAVPIGAMAATAAITAALFERSSTGSGRHLDISLAEAATWMLGGIDAALADQPMQAWADPGRTMYRCADDTWITVAAAEPRTWAALCAGLGLHHLADWAAAHALPSDDVERRVGDRLRHPPGSRLGRHPWSDRRRGRPRQRGRRRDGAMHTALLAARSPMSPACVCRSARSACAMPPGSPRPQPPRRGRRPSANTPRAC